MPNNSLWKNCGILLCLGSSLPAVAQKLIEEVPIDYSHCGYMCSDDTIPCVASIVSVPCAEGDMTPTLQHAIDQVSSLPLKNGMRGAIQLEAGRYTLNGRLKIHASGIVLRGAGTEQTILELSGVNRQPAIDIVGQESTWQNDTLWMSGEVIQALKPNSEVCIVHPSTKQWISRLGCEEYGGGISALGWKPGDVDIRYQRRTNGQGMLESPIPMHWGNDSVYVLTIDKNRRICQCGIEDLSIVASVADPHNPKDELHLWTGISIDHAEDCWVRSVNFQHLAGSGVIVQADGQRITIEDCLYQQPVSEEANHRRNAFYVLGQQVLVQRCVADHAMHAFATGWGAAGPNAFVQCEAREALSYSGAVEAWSTGLLMDIVDIDGHDLVMANIAQDNYGSGWTAANSMCWQCSAAMIRCYSPDTSNVNRAYGTWCQFVGNGIWKSTNSHIKPRSLFYGQLEQRYKAAQDTTYQERLASLSKILPRNTEASSSPSVEVAMAAAQEARQIPRLTLENWVKGIQASRKVEGMPQSLRPIKSQSRVSSVPTSQFTIANGKVWQGSGIALGGKYDTPWWNGQTRPNYLSKRAQPALTRFVPDRQGLGLTDYIDSVITYLDQKDKLVFDQCYGLWYDRRRDDHERVRRRDAECWAPFYEQPWARSGEGTAWEGLSRYDLMTPNSWYYNRLQEFCQKAPHHLLSLNHYFQHNILEAGAHWVDCPWRPVNNINGTVFPEPVPFTGDKRVFVAEWFYDIENPTMRQLHRQYIRQNLEQMRDCPNAVHLISNEYTGPLHFTRFWLECIAEWEAESGLHPIVALACTKDVQDSLLADPQLSKVIDIIQIQYWFYRVPDKRNPKDIWDPKGGLNMAPRQHMRKQTVGKTGFEEAYRSVYEYTTQYPDKAVTFYAQTYDKLGWAILMAGGSCCDVTLKDESLRKAITAMRPKDGDTAKVLSSATSAIVYFTQDGQTTINGLSSGRHKLVQVSHNGVITPAGTAKVSTEGSLQLSGHKDEIYWIQ